MPRRRSTIKPVRSTSHELSAAPKVFELENRIARLELLVDGIRSTCEEQHRVTVAIKAQLDHLSARFDLIR